MRFSLLAPVCLFVACTAAPDAPAGLRGLQGPALAAALQGAWCNSEDGGRSCWAYDVFLPDGRLQACGRWPDDPQPFFGVGVVTISGDRMCYRVTEASANFWVRPGSQYCTRILAVSPQMHRYQDLDSGRIDTLTRVPLAQAAPCGAP